MEKLQNTYNINLHWHSFELRPKSAPPIPPEYREQILARRPAMEAMAREVYGIESLSAGPFGTDSRPALIGAKVAEALGYGSAYHKRVLQAYWQEGRAIGQREVLDELAGELGMPLDQFEGRLADPQYEALVEQDIMMAGIYNLRGVPALIFGGKYLVPGAQPFEALEKVVKQALEEGLGE